MEKTMNNESLQQEDPVSQGNETGRNLVEILVNPNDKGCNDIFDITGDIKRGIYKTLNLDEYPYFKVSDMVWKAQGGYLLKSGHSWVQGEQILGNVQINWTPSTEFKTRWVIGEDGKPVRKDVACMGSQGFTKDFREYNLVDMDGIVELDNGNLLINRYGKYQPNLSFITRIPELSFQRISSKDLNFDEGNFSVVYGEFFVSKKGTKCFRVLPKEKAKHILIRDEWGGAFNKYRGRNLSEEKALYYRRASSNAGGSGYDYGVYEVNFRNRISEDDI